MSSCSGTPQTPARRARVSLHAVLLQVRSLVLPRRVLGCCDQSGPWGRSVRPHQRVHRGGSVQYCLFFHGLQLPVSCSTPEVGVSPQPLGQGLQPGCVHTASCPCRSGHPRCPRRATRPPAGGRCTIPMLGARAALRRGHRSPVTTCVTRKGGGRGDESRHQRPCPFTLALTAVDVQSL